MSILCHLLDYLSMKGLSLFSTGITQYAMMYCAEETRS